MVLAAKLVRPRRSKSLKPGVRKPEHLSLPGPWPAARQTSNKLVTQGLVCLICDEATELAEHRDPRLISVCFTKNVLSWWDRWSVNVRGLGSKPFSHCICILAYNQTLNWAVLGSWAFWMVFVSFHTVSCHLAVLLACLLFAAPGLPSGLLLLWSSS